MMMMMMIIKSPIFLLGCLGLIFGNVKCDTENVVGILSNLSAFEQIVTSSTLRWITTSSGKIPKNAVQGATIRGNAENGDVEIPVYICRTHANGMWIPGRIIIGDDSHSGKCTISIHGYVTHHDKYEVLENFEDGGKLNWMKRIKYKLPLAGSVSAGTESRMYIARKKASDPTSVVSYNIGRFDRNTGLTGKIYVVEDDAEKEYEDGEILVETEPIRYEMDKVTFNYMRARYHREAVTLGTAILRNEDLEDNNMENEISRVDTVIAYRHNKTVSWGHGHAILTGLPVKVKTENGSSDYEEFKWAIDNFTNSESTYQVETFLSPGRGVNVTLVGNWTEANLPYTGKVTAIYPDGSKKSRKIMGNKREVGLRDVHPELGPVYWLHNNTHVPTTTTTTTTTSTTTRTTSTTVTTSRTTSSTEEAKPIPASPMEEMNSTTKKGDLSSADGKKRENQSMLSDGPKSETSTSVKSSSNKLQHNIFILFIMLLLRIRT